MSKFITLLYLFILSSAFSQSEHRFKLNKTKDITLMATGFASIASAHFIKNQIQPLSKSQALNLNSSQVSSFDRAAISNHSTIALHLSDIGQFASLALPLSILAFQPPKNELLTHLVMLQEVALITTGLTYITKGLVLRTRPYAYRMDASLELKQSPDSRTSFFSGHTAITAAMTFYTASVISVYSKDKTLKTVSWITAALLPATAGYLRVKAGQHFYTDVIAAYIVGGGIGWLVPRLHKNKKISVSFIPYFYPNLKGVSLSLKM